MRHDQKVKTKTKIYFFIIFKGRSFAKNCPRPESAPLNVLKAKKEAGTNFLLLFQLRNMVAQFKKAYLHRPIRVQHFLTAAAIQKCLTYFQNMLAFLTINHLQAESRI